MNTKSWPFLFWTLMVLYFLFLVWLIFQYNYQMIDDVWVLWHWPERNVVVHSRASEGRMFYGFSQQLFFSQAASISNIRYLRVISWAGWAGFIALLYVLLKRLRNRDELSTDWVGYLTLAFMASSLPVLLYIGWVSCGDRWVSAILSLSAALLVYDNVGKGVKGWMAMAIAVALGVVALFFYQTCYPFFLLPSYCLYLRRKDGKLNRVMLAGILTFFLGLAVYYPLFRYSVRAMGITAGERTALSFDILDRLSFFFSYPINQAFNLNLFFDTKSAVSQAVFPVLVTGWILFEFFYRKRPVWTTIRYIVGMIGWWILGYLPQLVSHESFGPYRTMPVLGVMVFLLMADTLAPLVKNEQVRNRLGFALVALLLVRGGYVYYRYIVRPFNAEYNAVKATVDARYTARIKNVVFVLAEEDGFLQSLHVRHHKDEFAMPSTYKDWTPEPLVKQIVYELTGSRQQAATLKVSVYHSAGEIPDRSILSHDDVLFIDAQTLF